MGNVTKNVFETPLSGRDDWPPEDLVGFIAWFQDKLDMIPTQHRHTASVYLEVGLIFGEPKIDLSIYYDSPETQEEKDSRLKRDIERQKERQKQIEANERREYDRLKAKFGE